MVIKSNVFCNTGIVMVENIRENKNREFDSSECSVVSSFATPVTMKLALSPPLRGGGVSLNFLDSLPPLTD